MRKLKKIGLSVILSMALMLVSIPTVLAAEHTHSYEWRTYDHFNGYHTYEQYCKCGYVQQSFTRKCNGNCPQWNIIMEKLQ